MKKLLIATITLMLCACCAFMVACSSVEGTYKFDSITISMGDQSVEVKAGEEFQGISFTENYMVIDIKKDGSCTITSLGMATQGTWSKSGNVITITDEGESIEFTLDGDKLIAEVEGSTITLIKK